MTTEALCAPWSLGGEGSVSCNRDPLDPRISDQERVLGDDTSQPRPSRRCHVPRGSSLVTRSVPWESLMLSMGREEATDRGRVYVKQPRRLGLRLAPGGHHGDDFRLLGRMELRPAAADSPAGPGGHEPRLG